MSSYDRIQPYSKYDINTILRLDTTPPQETTPGDKKSKMRRNYPPGWFLTPNTAVGRRRKPTT